METIVIVGASLAGTRAAQTLRAEGYDGRIILVGEESEMPYDRPPLSKQFLLGDWAREDIALLTPKEVESLKLEFRLGVRATGLDREHKRLLLGVDGDLSYDGLIITTGARPRSLSGLDPHQEGVHVIRTMGDAQRLAEGLRNGQTLGIIGGGFLGSEVASAARRMGVAVTMLERDPEPMAAILGTRVGRVLADIQRQHGVDVRTESMVRKVVVGSVKGVPSVQVINDDETRLEFDNVLLSIGAVPNTEWLADSDVLIDNGVVCDDKLFVSDSIVTAGDVARINHPLQGFQRRIEHWTNAVQLGEVAAANLLAGRRKARSFRSVPYVWSDQFGSRIEIIGSPRGDDRVELLGSEAKDNKRLFVYFRDGAPSALVGINARSWMLGVRRRITDVAELNLAFVENLEKEISDNQAAA
ncbi:MULTISPECIES: NAD(P)/FAD-dependent oxidoreductase [Micrococcaceae]|uniref:NAD(P)/FAD-dependent oxidoreductase n=1 Tax=Micrococcaceae TaxID=1268 RepID=UPI001475F534|nr:FAD/NAD(P)-binding oxidoreductase [Arthrobacter sp. SF27]NMR32410.1 NAD(P)/FAD-dependent oxidoreductase [Arthrobacter sp. SF27]